MLARLLLLFVVVPLIELALLIEIGQLVGLLPTIALVVLTGIGGAALARAEGLRTLWSLRSALEAGRLPGRELMDGAAILVGGALLLTPGLLTDLVGFSLLLPPTRRWIQDRISGSLERRLRDGTLNLRVYRMGPHPPGSPRRTPGETPGEGTTRGEIVQEPDEQE